MEPDLIKSEVAEPEPEPDLDEFGCLLADREDERRWRAYHEGGHIAVAWALGAYLIRSDIVEQGRWGGIAVWRLGNDQFTSVSGVIITSAGPAAAHRHAPRRHDGGGKDREDIARDLRALCQTDDVARIVRTHCETEAKRLVDENWDAVEAIACALLKHECLTSDQIDEVLSEVRQARTEVERRRRAQEWASLVERAKQPAPVEFTRTR